MDVPQYKEYSRPYCLWEWDMLRCEAYTAQSKDAYQAITKAFEADLKLPEFTPSPKPTPTMTPTPTETEAPPEETPGESPAPTDPKQARIVFAAATASPSPTPSSSATPKPTKAPAGNVRKYSKAQHTAYQDYKKAYAAMTKCYKQYTYEKAKKASDDALLKLHDEFLAALTTYQGRTEELAKVVGYNKSISWKVKLEYDIKVDFR